MEELTIRSAALSDATRLLEIYGWYVEHTAISFEYETPSLEEFTRRIAHTLERYPYLVAERGGQILGYAYAGAFVGRRAYDWAAELTVYLAPDCRGAGIGRRLYGALEEQLRKMGILNLYARIGWCDEEDEYLTHASPAFHRALGFTLAGKFQKCGYKFGRWYDMIWMEKLIGSHSVPQPDIRSWTDVRKE